MLRRRFTDEQIAFALRQAEGGTAVGEICRMMGVSEATALTDGGRSTPAWAWPRSGGRPQFEEGEPSSAIAPRTMASASGSWPI